jgi:hypothetical protein
MLLEIYVRLSRVPKISKIAKRWNSPSTTEARTGAALSDRVTKIQKYRNSGDYSSGARGEPQFLPLIGSGNSYDRLSNGLVYILSPKTTRIPQETLCLSLTQVSR